MFKILRQMLRMVIPEKKYLLLRLLAKVVYLPKNDGESFEVLIAIGKRVLPQYRFKQLGMDWWDDDFFSRFLDRFDELHELNTDRKWMVYQLVRLVQNIAGDTVECGVFKGPSSYLICHSNQHNQTHKKFHYMFDSYEGLSNPGDNDGEHWSEGNLSFSMEDLEKTFEEFENKKFMKGWIPTRFDEVNEKRFSFVHIDVDLYEPTRNSIEFFYPRMNKGGILLCDDYMYNTCPGATKAVDEFLANKPEKMIALSGGGGFFIKGVETSCSSFA